MKTYAWIAWLGLAAVAAPLSPCPAHGGTYRGPGSGVGPSGPSGPSTPGSPTGGGPGAGPATGGASEAAGDLTAWQQWWALNRDSYLQLRAALLEGGDSLSKSDTFFLGPNAPAEREANRPSRELVNDHVVPALVELLAKEKSPDIATGAILALAKIGDQQSAKVAAALTAQLPSPNQEISETAALGLGLLADPSSSRMLVDLLANTDAGHKLVGREDVPTRTRAFAAYGLGLLGRNAANPDVRRYVVHHLASALDADYASYDVPVACLIAMGLVPLDPYRTPEKEVAPASSRAGQVAFLTSWLLDTRKPEPVRIYAPVALARLVGTDATLRPQLVATCCDLLGPTFGAAMHQSAVMALGIAADGDDDPIDIRARGLLRKHVGEGDRLARRLALIALARASGRRGVGSGWEPAVAETRGFLAAEMARGTTPERPWIGLALGILERGVVESGGTPSDSVRALLNSSLVQHGSPVENGAYALGLGLFGSGDSGKALMEALERAHDDQVRGHVSVAIGMARVAAGIEPLRKLVLESRYHPLLLREAAIGLGLLGDKSVSAALVEMLRDAQGLSAQSAVATALGYVGDARAVEPLLAMAVEPTKSNGVRAFSIVSLGLICDRRLLPWNTMIAADVNYWLPPSTLFDPVMSTGVLDIL